MVFVLFIYLFIRFDFAFLSEDRGEIRVQDKIKKIKEFQKQRKAHEKQKVIKTVREYKKTKRKKGN